MRIPNEFESVVGSPARDTPLPERRRTRVSASIQPQAVPPVPRVDKEASEQGVAWGEGAAGEGGVGGKGESGQQAGGRA